MNKLRRAPGLAGTYIAFMRNDFQAPGIYILRYVHGLVSYTCRRQMPRDGVNAELGTMWELIGYVALGFACFICLLVLGSAFDDR